MDDKLYELRTCLHVHGMDVRCVTDLPDRNGFVTGSRDKTAKLYVENETTKEFELIHTYKDAQHYIASLFVLLNNQNESVIYVGSNDGNIYVYKTDSSELKSKLTGHQSTVCSLNGDLNSKKIISGSWDKTARIWSDNLELNKLDGHSAAVWTTCLINDQLALTGSADKTIKIWNLNTNECTKSIDAHSDCVRDIKLINKEQFLSCSNDATIKRWNLNGDLLQQYDGHENYIYSITLISNDLNKLKFASCSEDKTLRTWINGQNQQSIRIPSQTLWSISKLKNNDLIVACSNGKVYIYTQNESLYAPEFLKNEIKEEVAKTNLHMNELGDIKVDKLPNKDILNLPGKKEGETKLIKDGETIIAYQWDSSKYEWVKIGDVVGTANASKDPSQKQEYEGKLYDFVFSVDIQEGAPPLKLPYNIDQNPYIVAQEFIDKHELTQAYLDEIANFIVKNSQVHNTIQQQTPQSTVGADPFTGSSSYRPESNDNLSASNTTSNLINEYYPLKNYFLFETINLDGIAKKLKEFGKSIETVELQITSDDVKSLLNLTDLSKPINNEQIEIIKKILKWPQINLFPVLDFVRMVVLIPKISNELCDDKYSNTFLDILLQSAVNSNSTPNQYLSLRCICNLFKNNEQFVKNYDQIILSKVNQCLQSGNKNVQVALSSLYMNYSVLFGKSNDNQDLRTELALNSIQMLQVQFDQEAQFRALVTIGTIVEQDKYLIDLIRSEDLFKSLQRLCNNVDKLGKCAQFLKAKIKG